MAKCVVRFFNINGNMKQLLQVNAFTFFYTSPHSRSQKTTRYCNGAVFSFFGEVTQPTQ